MAEEEEKSEGEEGEGKKGGNKMMLIIIIVLVLGGGGAGAFFALGGSGDKAAEDGEEGEEEFEEEEEEAGDSLPSAMLALNTFIVNLSAKGSFLKTKIQLEFGTPDLPATVDADTPKIRDTIIRVLSNKTAKDILSANGKENLRNEIREGVNETLGSEDVTEVYFSEFIVQ